MDTAVFNSSAELQEALTQSRDAARIHLHEALRRGCSLVEFFRLWLPVEFPEVFPLLETADLADQYRTVLAEQYRGALSEYVDADRNLKAAEEKLRGREAPACDVIEDRLDELALIYGNSGARKKISTRSALEEKIF